ncbi:MAG: hypothetical protein NT062_07290 [Proteobacteria bacterium]|nr:hypothetical protein [Pseudomonadota bacterium]
MHAFATYSCQQCGAGLHFDGVRSERCPYCASPNVVERAPTADQPRPRFVVAFAHEADHARAILTHWLGSRTLFADARIKRGTVENLRGVYLPAYLYSAATRTAYTESIGEHYTETEEHETTDAQGKKSTETRRVTRTEYRPLAGDHVGYVTDVVVSASIGLAHHELHRVEPFDMLHLRRYEPAVISGWITEEFSRTVAECTAASRTEVTDQVGTRLRRFMPGDSHSDLQWKTQVSWESLDPILLPIWVAAVRYRDDKPPLRVVINGQTGRATGHVPLAWWKIALVVGVVLAIVVTLLVLRDGSPP